MARMSSTLFVALSLPAISFRVAGGHRIVQTDGETMPLSLTLLPQDKGDESPACLDGSPYAFYFVPTTTGSTKWTFFIQGGGWCFDEESCLDRSKTFLGSSDGLARSGEVTPDTSPCRCMNVMEDGSTDIDCNCIYMPYCDGASFSGFRPDAWPVPSNTSQKLYFRGIKNWDGTVDFAFENGLDQATEVVISGQSAGGLTTLLRADSLGERLAKQAPDCTHYRAGIMDGFFLDSDTYNGADFYPNQVTYLHDMQNVTTGSGALNQACEEAHPGQEQLCFMSPHAQVFVQTPFFMFNSKYDTYQLANIWRTNFTAEENRPAVLQYGEDFLEQFEPVQEDETNGAMITSCVCHGCPWTDLVLEGKNSWQHYADWYYGKTKGSAAVHIDPRLPNGDGSFHFPQTHEIDHGYEVQHCVPLE